MQVVPLLLSNVVVPDLFALSDLQLVIILLDHMLEQEQLRQPKKIVRQLKLLQ